jgi:hypothetical protein
MHDGTLALTTRMRQALNCILGCALAGIELEVFLRYRRDLEAAI